MISFTFTPGIGPASHYARCRECFATRELHNRPGRITSATCTCGGQVETWGGYEVIHK